MGTLLPAPLTASLNPPRVRDERAQRNQIHTNIVSHRYCVPLSKSISKSFPSKSPTARHRIEGVTQKSDHLVQPSVNKFTQMSMYVLFKITSEQVQNPSYPPNYPTSGSYQRNRMSEPKG